MNRILLLAALTGLAAEQPHNLAWGDDNGKTLYMTALTSIYRMRLKVEGIRP